MAFRNLGIALRRSISPPRLSPYAARVLPVAVRRKSVWYGGHGYIEDVVTIRGVPTPNRRVRLFDQRTGKLVAETFSGAGGVYRFEYIDRSLTYFVLGHDHEQMWDMVAHGDIAPELMP